MKEYATIYGADQYTYEGIKNGSEIDDSHHNIIRDPGKCVLCGSCVRTTEEFGEGVVQFANRGFVTVVEPAFGDPLGSVNSQLIGSLADACPTGALEELPYGKPGPFELEEKGTTHCADCGIGCPTKLMMVGDTPVRLVPDTPYGHLCDRGKFRILRELSDEDNDPEKIAKYLKDGLVDIYVSGDVTFEELKKLKEMAKISGGNIYSPHAPSSVSTANLEELLKANKIYVEEEAYRESPLLKYFVKKATDSHAQKVSTLDELEGGIAILSSSTNIKPEKRIVAQRYANSAGLYGTPLKGDSGRKVLLYGLADIDVEAREILKIDGGRNWLTKEGNFKNIFGETLHLTPILGKSTILDDILDYIR